MPIKNQFTIYSKSGCSYCIKVKELLINLQLVHTIIDCDAYIKNENDRTLFLQFIHNVSSVNYTTFPMIFDGTKFVGGYSNIEPYLDKLLDFDTMF